jgi:hypothetical protein
MSQLAQGKNLQKKIIRLNFFVSFFSDSKKKKRIDFLEFKFQLSIYIFLHTALKTHVIKSIIRTTSQIKSCVLAFYHCAKVELFNEQGMAC